MGELIKAEVMRQLAEIMAKVTRGMPVAVARKFTDDEGQTLPLTKEAT